MYDERKEKFSFKSFFLTLLFVLLFVFLMLFLFPTRWDVNKAYGNLQSTQDIERLSVLYDEIFANNVARMKDAAIGYYTNERLPKNVGDSSKLTLKQMYDLHLVLKMKDKDGKACDATKSYVEMTKYTEEYRLKVNLSCGDQEDFIIVYLGCYNYCPSGVCEKRVPTPSKTTAKEEKITKSEDQKVPEKYYCKIVNNKYYDAKGNVVSLKDYKVSCGIKDPDPEPTKYYCKIVNNKYYDANGNIVGLEKYKTSCGIIDPVKNYCKIVDGKYYDAAGNAVTYNEYKTSCGIVDPDPVVKKYAYEYKLVTEDKTTCAAWTDWQKDEVKATDLVKVETKSEKEITSYKTMSIQTGTKKETVTKTIQEKYIKSYGTEIVTTGSYEKQVGTTKKTITNNVYAGTIQVFEKTDSGTKVPKSNSKYVYTNVRSDIVKTCSYCQIETIYLWDVYRIEPVYKTITETKNIPVYETVYTYEEKQIPIYGIRDVTKTEVIETPVYEEFKVPVYGNVTYYRSQTCTFTKGTTDIKWSNSKLDVDLISKGYKLTGNVKEI